MALFEAIRTAFGMIRAHKLRAFFTVLGTVVGVTFLIAVITLIEGMNAYMEEDFASKIYGFNTVMLRRTPAIGGGGEEWREWRNRPRWTFDDAEWIGERMETPGTLALSSMGFGNTVEGPEGTELESVMLNGASASFFRVRDLEMTAGRAFSDNEAERGAPVAVIGQEVAETLFGDRIPLGQTIRIDGFPYRVIGVLEEQGSLFGMISMDRQVIAPARSPLNGLVNPHDVVDEIQYKVPDASLLPAAMAEMEGLARIRHRLRPGEPNDFIVETADEGLSFWNEFSRYMLIALPGLVGISLVVGGVVIMNIMLVSVADRTREIGLRKSLGARRRDILRQFLIEAGTLSGAGGVLGIGAGIALAALVAAVSPVPARVAPWAVGLGLFLGVGVGLVAGVYPAWRASRLDPIEALRHE